MRANQVAGDTLYDSGAPTPSPYLPRVNGADGLPRDVVLERHTWMEISPAPGNELLAGSDRRFAVDQPNCRVRVLTDAFGTLQAFLEVP